MSALTEISTSFHFEAAHRLICGYEGKCRNLHGHSFLVQCHLVGSKLDKYGMLKDFKDFNLIKSWCKEFWDHSVLLHKEDYETIDYLKATNQRYFLFDENPTSEVLAHFLLNHSESLGLSLDAVTINETCTHSCTARKSKVQ